MTQQKFFSVHQLIWISALLGVVLAEDYGTHQPLVSNPYQDSELYNVPHLVPQPGDEASNFYFDVNNGQASKVRLVAPVHSVKSPGQLVKESGASFAKSVQTDENAQAFFAGPTVFQPSRSFQASKDTGVRFQDQSVEVTEPGKTNSFSRPQSPPPFKGKVRRVLVASPGKQRQAPAQQATKEFQREQNSQVFEENTQKIGSNANYDRQQDQVDFSRKQPAFAQKTVSRVVSPQQAAKGFQQEQSNQAFEESSQQSGSNANFDRQQDQVDFGRKQPAFAQKTVSRVVSPQQAAKGFQQEQSNQAFEESSQQSGSNANFDRQQDQVDFGRKQPAFAQKTVSRVVSPQQAAKGFQQEQNNQAFEESSQQSGSNANFDRQQDQVDFGRKQPAFAQKTVSRVVSPQQQSTKQTTSTSAVKSFTNGAPFRQRQQFTQRKSSFQSSSSKTSTQQQQVVKQEQLNQPQQVRVEEQAQQIFVPVEFSQNQVRFEENPQQVEVQQKQNNADEQFNQQAQQQQLSQDDNSQFGQTRDNEQGLKKEHREQHVARFESKSVILENDGKTEHEVKREQARQYNIKSNSPQQSLYTPYNYKPKFVTQPRCVCYP